MKKWFVKEEFWLFLMLILGAFLRFYHVEFQSPWMDEISTLKVSSSINSLGDMYSQVLKGNHPPFYFLSIHSLFELFGEGIFVARMFSVVMGVFGILAIYYLAKELVSARFAFIPTLLTTVNFFHIEHSQEARMYTLLFLSATLSMLFLIRFIKNQTTKSAIFYGLTAGLLLNSHIIALFVLFAQGIILLIYILQEKNLARQQLIYKSLLSYGIALVLYIPSFFVLLKVIQKESFWIAKPKWDEFKFMTNIFFGKSDILLIVIALISIFGIYLLIKNKELFKVKGLNLGIILGIWILVPFIIALVISFLKIPMIIPRYFISLLPAIIILVSIGIYGVKNLPIRGVILASIVLFSMYVLIVERDYYNKVTKAQFRETSAFINDNSNGSTIVSSTSRYISYFLGKAKFDFIDKDLNTFVTDLKTNNTEVKDFWYFDAHNRPYEPSETTLVYLDSLYHIIQENDFHDAYTKNFLLKSAYNPTLDLSGLDVKQNESGAPLKNHIDELELNNNYLYLLGWAYLKETDSKGSNIHVLLTKNRELKKIFKPKLKVRKDVTTYFKSDVNLDYSGIEIKENLDYLEPGEYEFQIYIENDGKRGLGRTYRKITIE